MNTQLNNLQELRTSYNRVRNALPWLDACVRENEQPAFPEFAAPLTAPHVKSATAQTGLAGNPAALRDCQSIRLLRYESRISPPPAELPSLLSAMASEHLPLVVLHTDFEVPRTVELARAHPDLNIIVESGPRKILYIIDQVEQVLLECANVYLCTYNFCNWFGIERLCAKGLGGKLLYGSHWPVYDPNVAMGPIVMAHLSWREKTDIAGNNLRRLLGLDPVYPKEEIFVAPEPFIIDAHGHNVGPDTSSPYDFPVPDECMQPHEWTQFMDSIGVEQLVTVPGRALYIRGETSRAGARPLCLHAPARFRYLAVFDPGRPTDHVTDLERSLEDPSCVGIKIHPSLHRTSADDNAYAPVYEIAMRCRKPILAHTWEVSSHNPSQQLSHPDRFRKHLSRYPETRLVMGHAGGRPSAFDAVAAICRDFPHVAVDLAGDYFDNGLVDMLGARLGIGNVLFASDMDWIDPRCMLGAALGSRLSDHDLLRVLRGNAIRVYGLPG